MLENKAFIEELADILEVDTDELTPTFNLSEDNWDSLAIVSTIAIIDEHFNKLVDGQKLADCKTINELAELIGAN